MSINSTKILFLITLISGMLISLCSNSWLGAWMGLEINMLSFIPLISSKKSMFTAEVSLKYFLIQAIASSIFLFLILFKINFYEMLYFLNNKFWNNSFIIPFLMKTASAPFHWWLPAIIEGLSWFNCFIMLSIQKIAPLILISYLLSNNLFIQLIIISSAFIGAMGGLNQTSLRKIMSFSSINHIGWMLMAMIMGINMWFNYFLIYTINILLIFSFMNLLNLSYILQIFNSFNSKKLIKTLLWICILSLGGLPPLLGFFPKWIIIQFMIYNSIHFTTIILVLLSLLTLFFYLRIMYSTLMIMNTEMLWSIFYFPTKKNFNKTYWLSLVISGILSCTLVILML
nr:NADH dehydrogenase subunit 2 [Decimiana sp. JZ-2017]